GGAPAADRRTKGAEPAWPPGDWQDRIRSAAPPSHSTAPCPTLPAAGTDPASGRNTAGRRPAKTRRRGSSAPRAPRTCGLRSFAPPLSTRRGLLRVGRVPTEYTRAPSAIPAHHAANGSTLIRYPSARNMTQTRSIRLGGADLGYHAGRSRRCSRGRPLDQRDSRSPAPIGGTDSW